jgi:hypothetical protein
VSDCKLKAVKPINLLVRWNRRSCAVLRKQGILVLCSLKGHLTADIKAILLVVERTHVMVKKTIEDHIK